MNKGDGLRIIGIDFGDKRTGIAVSDESEFLASPVAVVTEPSLSRLISAVAGRAKEYDAGMIVVGHPKNMDGSEGEKAQKYAAYAKMLEEESGVPVKLWDERSSTAQAHKYMNETMTKSKKRKSTIDAAAATVILQSYLDANQKAR